jgi:hypothetical protein
MQWKPSSKPSSASHIVCLFTNLRYTTTSNVIDNIRVNVVSLKQGLQHITE